NAQSSDTNSTTASLNNASSNFLKCTGFGFSIPTGSTITGIQVEWQRNGSSIVDNAVRIVKGDAIGSTDRSNSSAVTWPASDGFTSYGGGADLWGASWTAADINAANFGAALSGLNPSSGNKTASVNSLRITVSYEACGNGVTDAGEQCDDGAANGTLT